MFLIIPLLPLVLLAMIGGGLAGVAISAIIIAIVEFFSHKKTLLTGPQASGKTTFLQYLSEEKIPSGASGAPRTYNVKDAAFDVVTDFSGADIWLNEQFDVYIQNHDYILFFFDVSEFVKDCHYRINISARLDKIHEHVTSQIVLLIGTHIDKVQGNYIYEVEQYFSGQSYQDFLKRIVYVDTTNKECVRTIFEGLNK